MRFWTLGINCLFCKKIHNRFISSTPQPFISSALSCNKLSINIINSAYCERVVRYVVMYIKFAYYVFLIYQRFNLSVSLVRSGFIISTVFIPHRIITRIKICGVSYG